MALPFHNKLLAVNAFVLGAFILLVRLNLLWPPPLSSNLMKKTFSLNESFERTVRDAYESIEYLYLMQKGKAKIGSVVESRKAITETFCYCAYCAPTFVIIGAEKSDGNPFSIMRWIHNDNEIFHLFSAYLDARFNSLFPDVLSVQILASAFDFDPEDNNVFSHYCHFASSDSASILFSVEAHIRMIWQRGWDPRKSFYNAYLITCPIPKHHIQAFIDHFQRDKSAITVSSQKCPAWGRIEFLRIKYSEDLLQVITKTKIMVKKSRLKIGVCVKGMDFLDGEISERKLLEWLELQYALGANSITIYIYYVPPKITAIFLKYVREGRLNVIQLELPGESPNLHFIRHQYIWRNRQQKRRHELIPYNDCFYRYAHSHDFVLIVDTDEIVVPLRASNWPDLLADMIEQQESTSNAMSIQLSAISVQNVFKFSGMESAGSIFDSHNRSATIQERGLYGKSFISTKSIATVFNHFALHRLHANVSRTIYIDENKALKLHYKSECPYELKKKCEELQKNTILDNSLDRYRDKVISVVDDIYNKL